MGDKDEFGKYINTTRVSISISLEQLADGICTPSGLNRIEHGERFADKLTRDRLLGRLGIDGYDYENYLNVSEYEQWKIRMNILDNISDGILREAVRDIDKYMVNYDNTNGFNIKKQFCQFAYAQILKRKGYNKKIGRYFSEALRCTVNCLCADISEMILSVQELSLIMDDAYYNRKPGRMKIYEEIVRYIKRPYFDIFSKAMIYPKAVVYICNEIFKEKNNLDIQSYRKMFILCDEAKNILMEARRDYYLWEITRILKNIYQYFENNCDKCMYENTYSDECKENQGFMEAFRKARNIANISVRMKDDTYIYKEYGVYCIADVIHKRRKTLGLTLKQLSDGFITERTLAKIESGKVNPHISTVKELFSRLNLPSEHSRLEIITDKVEAKDTIRKLIDKCNALEYEEAMTVLIELKKMVNLDIPVNRQFILRIESQIKLNNGLIDKKQHLDNVIHALECTIPHNRIKYSENLYLTQEELLCVNAILVRCKYNVWDSEKLEFIKYVIGNCNDRNHEWIYDVFMSNIASWYGNDGDYDISDELSYEIIKNCIMKKRLELIDTNFYNIAWNMKMNDGVEKNIDEHNKLIMYAYYFAAYCKHDKYKEIFRKKLIEI